MAHLLEPSSFFGTQSVPVDTLFQTDPHHNAVGVICAITKGPSLKKNSSPSFDPVFIHLKRGSTLTVGIFLLALRQVPLALAVIICIVRTGCM